MLFLSGGVWAYAFNGVAWTWQDHAIEDPFTIDAASFPTDVGTEAEIQSAFESAMADWNAVGRDVTLTSAGLGTGVVLEADGHVGFHYEDIDEYSTGGTLAFAATWTWDDVTAFDCDVTFLENTDYGDIDWDASEVQDTAQIDVQATALHELGHCLGFDHSADSSAVMYAYYAGLRSLTSDDIAGLGALYGDPCVDGDGDGYSDCTGDCDDSNAGVHPGGDEVCNGADDNCDGVVDASTRTATLADGSSTTDGSWAGTANVVHTEAATVLHSWRQHIQATADTRLAWTLHVSDSESGPWTLVRSEPSYATGVEWESSPAFDQPLESGRYYAIGVGSIGPGATAWWESLASRAQQGPLKPKGGLYGRALGDEYSTISTTYLWHQELLVDDLADEDGDGVTGLCGDCAPEDETIAEGLTEACDGVDNDCDGAVDEDVGDADNDGTVDCLDPCPEDAADDADGDGLCADVDPCPEDPDDDCEDTGTTDTDSPDDTDDPDDTHDADDTDEPGDSEAVDDDDKGETPDGGCGCAVQPHSRFAGAVLLGLLSLAWRRRR